MTENVNVENRETNFATETDVQECTLNKEEKPQEKMFSQSRLEEIISERLSRERKQNEALTSVKHLLRNISERGLLKGASYSEMANDLMEKLESFSKEDEAQSVAEGEANSPYTSLGAEGDGIVNARKAEEETTEKVEDDECTSFVKVLSGIKAKYPKITVEKLLSGNGFERFAKGRIGKTEEIFDDYCSFMEGLEGYNEKENTDSHSEFASTAFSAYSGIPDEGENLTKQQMEIAKSAGMSYREYAMLLESVPKRQHRTF